MSFPGNVYFSLISSRYVSFPFGLCQLVDDCETKYNSRIQKSDQVDPGCLGDPRHLTQRRHQVEDRLERRVNSEGVSEGHVLALDKPEVHRGDCESRYVAKVRQGMLWIDAGKLKRYKTQLGGSGLEGRVKAGFHRGG